MLTAKMAANDTFWLSVMSPGSVITCDREYNRWVITRAGLGLRPSLERAGN